MRLAPEEAVSYADFDSNLAAAGSNILRHILLLAHWKEMFPYLNFNRVGDAGGSNPIV